MKIINCDFFFLKKKALLVEKTCVCLNKYSEQTKHIRVEYIGGNIKVIKTSNRKRKKYTYMNGKAELSLMYPI